MVFLTNGNVPSISLNITPPVLADTGLTANPPNQRPADRIFQSTESCSDSRSMAGLRRQNRRLARPGSADSRLATLRNLRRGGSMGAVSVTRQGIEDPAEQQHHGKLDCRRSRGSFSDRNRHGVQSATTTGLGGVQMPTFAAGHPCSATSMASSRPNAISLRWESRVISSTSGSLGSRAASRRLKRRSGKQWQKAFLRAPIWRFWLGADLCGVSAIRASMPSLDKVGRYFPLTLFACADQGATIPPPEIDAQDEWFKAAEDFLISTDHEKTFEAVVLDLNGLAAPLQTELANKPAASVKAAQSASRRPTALHRPVRISACRPRRDLFGHDVLVDGGRRGLRADGFLREADAGSVPVCRHADRAVCGCSCLKHAGGMDPNMEQKISWAEAGAATHIGKARQQNEDNYLVLTKSGVWAVADGMGGHSAGDLASFTVVQELRRFSRPHHPPPSSLPIGEARIVDANNRLRKITDERQGRIIGTTVAVLLVYEEFFACIWAGDSRIYRMGQSGI